jgi:hypothetical protein
VDGRLGARGWVESYGENSVPLTLVNRARFEVVE